MSTVPKGCSRKLLMSSLKANGQSAYGTKQEMYDRLVSGEERKKPGPKLGSKRVIQPELSLIHI